MAAGTISPATSGAVASTYDAGHQRVDRRACRPPDVNACWPTSTSIPALNVGASRSRPAVPSRQHPVDAGARPWADTPVGNTPRAPGAPMEAVAEDAGWAISGFGDHCIRPGPRSRRESGKAVGLVTNDSNPLFGVSPRGRPGRTLTTIAPAASANGSTRLVGIRIHDRRQLPRRRQPSATAVKTCDHDPPITWRALRPTSSASGAVRRGRLLNLVDIVTADIGSAWHHRDQACSRPAARAYRQYLGRDSSTSRGAPRWLSARSRRTSTPCWPRRRRPALGIAQLRPPTMRRYADGALRDHPPRPDRHPDRQRAVDIITWRTSAQKPTRPTRTCYTVTDVGSSTWSSYLPGWSRTVGLTIPTATLRSSMVRALRRSASS